MNRRRIDTHTVLTTMLAGALMLAGCATPAGSMRNARTFDFESDAPDVLPQGWSQHHWGNGTTSWGVEPTGSGQVLAQRAATNPNRHFNIAVYDALQVKDVTLTVRLKAVDGKHDQGGGIVWRYRDEQNHYIVRANPLEDNVVLYKMEDGVRTDLPLTGAGRTYGVKVAPLGKAWHTLMLRAVGDEFTVHLNGKELFRVRDEAFGEPGRVGLWTKADAVTWFDDFAVSGNK